MLLGKKFNQGSQHFWLENKFAYSVPTHNFILKKLKTWFVVPHVLIVFQFIMYRNEEIPGLAGHFQCTTMVTITKKMHKDIYNGVYAVLHFLIPLIVTVVCYSSIVIQLTAKAKQHESNKPRG